MDPATKTTIAVNRAMERARNAMDRASGHTNAAHYNLQNGSTENIPEILGRLECAMRELHDTAMALSVAQGIRKGADIYNPPHTKDQ